MPRRPALFFAALFAALLLAMPAAAAAGEEPREMSLGEAVFRALCFSKSVEKAELELEKAEDARVSAAGAVQPQWYTTYEPGCEPLIFAAESADFAYRSARESYRLARDTVVLDVYSRYYAVLQAQEKVAAKEAALTALEKRASVMQALVQTGMAARTALLSLEAQVTSAEADLTAAEGELKNAYVSFNQLVKLPAEERPVLTDTAVFAPFAEDESRCVSWATGENPTVWIAKYAEEYKQMVQNYDTGDASTVIREEDVRMAELDAESAEDAAALLGRTLYSSIESLEAAYSATAEGVRVAEEALRVVQVKFELGMATSSEVAAAEAEVQAARQGLFALACEHAYMKLAAEMPWAYLGVLSQTQHSES